MSREDFLMKDIKHVRLEFSDGIVVEFSGEEFKRRVMLWIQAQLFGEAG